MGTHVLVVDDDAALLRLLKITLQTRGFQVSVAHDGAEALEFVSDHPVDAVVLDLQMPVMDGRTFHREMRARGICPPVLILSAYDARAAQRQLQAEAALNKPFDPDDLATRLEELVAARA